MWKMKRVRFTSSKTLPACRQSPPHTAAAATQPSPHSGLVSQPYCAPAHPFLRYPLLPLLRCCLTIMCDPIQTQSVTFFVCYSQSRDGHCCADAPQKSGHFHSARLRYASALKAQVGRAHATHSFRRCLKPGSLGPTSSSAAAFSPSLLSLPFHVAPYSEVRHPTTISWLPLQGATRGWRTLRRSRIVSARQSPGPRPAAAHLAAHHAARHAAHPPVVAHNINWDNYSASDIDDMLFQLAAVFHRRAKKLQLDADGYAPPLPQGGSLLQTVNSSSVLAHTAPPPRRHLQNLSTGTAQKRPEAFKRRASSPRQEACE